MHALDKIGKGKKALIEYFVKETCLFLPVDDVYTHELTESPAIL